MKFLLAVASVIAVAVAGPTQRGLVTPVLAEAAPVVADTIIASPIVADSSPVVDISPAWVDFPLTETGEIISAPAEVTEVAPVAVEPVATSSAPLVQIILNINQAQSGDVSPVPVVVPEPVITPEPIQIVDNWPVVAPVSPVDVVDVSPVDVVEVSPIEVIEVAPVAVTPVIIGTPIIPVEAVNLPEELN